MGKGGDVTSNDIARIAESISEEVSSAKDIQEMRRTDLMAIAEDRGIDLRAMLVMKGKNDRRENNL
jgi:hypothetical protein